MSTTQHTTPVVIHYADGRLVEVDSYEDAVAAIESEFADAEIGHDGDLLNGGDRTLCWADTDSSVNDDGAHAVASIQWTR